MIDAPARDSSTQRFAPALFLLFLAVLINYVDRGNLSIAAPLLREQWGLSASRLGVLLSAFFWTYTLMQFVSGWLVDQIEVSKLLALGFLLWSVATAATGLANGFALLLVFRLLLGIGECVIFPACSKLLALHLPEESRGFANGVIAAAIRCGSVVGTFGGGLLMARHGWRFTFLAIGLVSLLWLPAWMHWRPRDAGIAPAAASQPAPGFAAILAQRSFWGTSIGHFCNNYLLYFMITWLPFYLVREQHHSMAEMSRIAALYYLTDAASGFVAGWVSDRLIRRGGAPTLVRKSIMAGGCALAAAGLLALAVATPGTYLSALIVTAAGGGTAAAGSFLFGQTLAGPRGAGRWTGLQNGFANLAGVIGPALTGYLVERTGHFRIALGITAGVAVVGGVVWIVLIGRLAEIRWSSTDSLPVADPAMST